MGIIGMYFLAKTLNSSSRSGGGRHSSYYDRQESRLAAAKERAKELGYIREAMEAVNGFEITDGAEVPARVRKGVQRLFISKKRDIKHRSIVILKADPNGVQMPETGVDFSRYSAVGVIDGETLCMFEKNTGDLIMMDISAGFDYGPHGDFYTTTYPILDGRRYMDNDWYELPNITTKFTRVKADGTVVDNEHTPMVFHSFVRRDERHKGFNIWPIEFGAAIREEVGKFRAKQAQETKSTSDPNEKQ